MLIYLAILPLCSALQCNSYRCAPDGLDDNKCIEYYSATEVYLQNCPDGYGCPASNLPSDVYCQKLGNDTQLAWPGEPCSEEIQCAYGECQNKFCKGTARNEFCKVHDECEPRLRCYMNKCTSLLDHYDKGCVDDYDCINNSGCDGGTCKAYLATKEASKVNVCNDNYSMFCQSTMCYSNYCLGFISNDINIPAVCSSDLDCTSSHYSQDIFPIQFHTPCECGLNPSGTAYCALFPGDSYKEKYLKKLSLYFSSGASSYCNTVRRTSNYCIRTHWGEENYLDLMYLKYMSELYPSIIDADNCSRKIYLSSYDEILEEMNKDETEDWSIMIGWSSVMVMIMWL